MIPFYLSFDWYNTEMRVRLESSEGKGEEIILDELDNSHGMEGEEFEVEEAIALEEKTD